MCGINGFSFPSSDLITKMNKANRLRGPDDTGTYVDDRVSLGHNRLSIIDLSPNGHQPMSNEDDTVWIVYNGEVYNFQELRERLIAAGHRFKSDTDTEVILHGYEEYGFECEKHFNGMWAFCIYDKRKNLLFLGRDQYGIKPLYYRLDDRNIAFSSTISGLLCHGRDEPDPKAIMMYLAYNLEDYDEDTFFLHVKRLLPGHSGVYDLKTRTLEVKAWYSDEGKAVDRSMDAENLRNTFIASVRSRTISDVPIGACLSGGIDSSSIVCVLDSLLDQRFKCFSMVAPGFKRDESKYIDIVGQSAEIDQYRVEIGERQFYDDLLDFMLYQEEPVIGMSTFAQYQVMKLAHGQQMKVLLDGQGGDEILGGYTYYFGYHYLELLRKMKLGTLAKEFMSDWTYNQHQNNLFPVMMFGFLLIPDPLKFEVWSRTMEKWVNKQHLVEVCGRKGDPRWYVKTMDGIQQMSLRMTAIPEMLRYEDKNSMRFGIESRVPFLDPDLVEYCRRLAIPQRISKGVSKKLFREAMKGIVPDAILSRRDKVGFESRVDDFFRSQEIVDLCNKVFTSQRFRSRPYWVADNVMALLNDHVSGKARAGDKLWKILTTELWLRMFFESQEPSLEKVTLQDLVAMES